MKAPRFEYRAATSVAHATELLAEYDGDAKVLAGGQSLVPLLNFRLSNPAALVDINGLGELGGHRLGADELHVGAVCRHREIERDPQIAARCPAIADAVAQIGHVAIRNRGTVVGSIAHADPAAEWPGLAMLLDAQFTARAVQGERTIAAGAFFDGFLSTVLDPTEVITAVTFPLPPVASGSAWIEFARRHGDFALVGVGAVIECADESITSARIVVTGVSDTPVRVAAAERVLHGAQPGEALFAEAGRVVATQVDPISDIHGDATYRRRLAQVLTRRALAVAADRAA
ncbi:MAG: xanthine dehydrogenase family protein subunit M [Jatrophihabitans sp.]|nr:MAG: xanthine dehydrogenase family protein subunit M [Jatrophihabitans sp.]